MLWGHCPFPHPRPGSPNSRPGESRARLAPGPVTHPKPVPVPAGPDSARAFPRAHLGPLVSRPCPHSPSSRDPDGAAGRQFLPRELWGGDRATPVSLGSSLSPQRGAVCVRAADGDTAHGPQNTPGGLGTPKSPFAALGGLLAAALLFVTAVGAPGDIGDSPGVPPMGQPRPPVDTPQGCPCYK